MKPKRGPTMHESGAQPDAEHADGGPRAVRGEEGYDQTPAGKVVDQTPEGRSGRAEKPEEELARLRAREEELLRALAEMTNVQKRRKAESEQIVRYAHESLVRELLPVLDDFERALAAMPVSPEDPLRAGVEMVQQRLVSTLEKEGLAPLRPAGETFDPNLHDAIGQRPAPPGITPGTVLEVAQPGYALRDRILRHARVVVASAQAVGPTQTTAPATPPSMEGDLPRPPDTISPPLDRKDRRGA